MRRTEDVGIDSRDDCRVAGSSDMGSEHYCLRWNNHQSNLLGVFSQLLESESLVDVTLACTEGPSIRAHKVVLSACSSYFQALFLDHPNRHPIVILKDVRFSELRTLVDFMYKGEVNVEYCQLSALLKTAESLKVKGLADMTNINAAVASKDDQQHLNSESLRETRGETRERDKDRDKEREKEIPKTEPDLQHQQQQPQQQQQRDQQQRDVQQQQSSQQTSQIANNESSEAVDMTECPTSPSRASSPCPGPLALDRPRRDSEDAVSLEETRGSLSPISVHSGPSDMSLTNNTGTPGVLPLNLPQSRLPSPHSTEPLAGPSGLPPVQQVPLSLKKEVDWERSTEERCASSEMSADYRLPPDPVSLYSELMGVDERVFACMYCGASFLHQSKLTRHILSHSLESLKYREQAHLQLQAQLGLEPGMHLPPEAHFPSGGPVEPMDLELAAHSDPTSGVVLCKFCGKSFPDVGSLIAHLPAHTGDRPFKCEFCGKAFKLRHHMKDHCRVHTGERPFRCTLCGKTFSRSTILKAHEKTHYPKYVRKFLSPSPVDPSEEEAPPPPPPPHH
ncbi:protein bric-a-brac 1-like isoform X4 [Chelonus insularis]|uniref:protein bric-a-brac 1-like isoform X4 n=1 Tax=Chelonus insularis TaxID=460826 RepID=UPI001588C4D0|nr:protein bric-a-brac 1-like isoform X4 [Chelonus insularis]